MNGLARLIAKFRGDTHASVAVVMSLSMIPAMGIAGASLDYGRALRAAAQLQHAIDSATLTGAIHTLPNREQVSSATFQSILAGDEIQASASALFTTTQDAALGTIYNGTATAQVPTSVMKLMGAETIVVQRSASALFGTGDDSCILTLGGELDLDDDSMTFNGSPNVNLTGCTIRSNTSIKCNGNGIGTVASIAAGSVFNCPNPMPNQGVVPDIHAAVADNIEHKCGGISGSVTWKSSPPELNAPLPTGSFVQSVARDGYEEIHICGNLTITGAGVLDGANDNRDLVIVVENGDITMASNASIDAPRTTFVLTGMDAKRIDFPQGKGHLAELRVSSSVSNENPWAGFAIYQNPNANGMASASWAPGASIVSDGITYLPRTELTLSGNAATGPSDCSKLITHTFRINGGVSLTQNSTGCANQKVTQFRAHPRLLN